MKPIMPRMAALKTSLLWGVTLCVILPIASDAIEITFSRKAEDALPPQKSMTFAVYRMYGEYDEAQALRIASIGQIDLSNNHWLGRDIILNGEMTTRRFGYFVSACWYAFQSDGAEPYYKGPVCSESDSKKQADAHLQRLMGVDGEKYVFLQMDVESVQTAGSEKPQLMYRYFIYTKVVDGFPVLDNSTDVRIGVGKNGVLNLLSWQSPKLQLARRLQVVLNKDAIKQKLLGDLETVQYYTEQSGGQAPIATEVADARLSYAVVEEKGERFLMPHVTFTCISTLTNSEQVSHLARVRLDEK